MSNALRWVLGCVALSSCVPTLTQAPRPANTTLPEHFAGLDAGMETTSAAQQTWRTLFSDPKLTALIDAALEKNQELNIVSLEVDLANNEVMSREGEFLPKVNAQVGAGLERVGRYTSQGASDEANSVAEHLQDYGLGLSASWELDIWGKLRNATKAARARYLASAEGRKFAVSVLVAEVAKSYFELLSLDAQREVVHQNLQLQTEAMPALRLQKEAARVTELAVKRFEAEVLRTQAREFSIGQKIIETENHLNFLLGRVPQHIDRSADQFLSRAPTSLSTGLPSALLENRPDVKRAELELVAAQLDVDVARAAFYPTVGLKAGLGVQAFDLLKLVTTPASIFYNVGADLLAPLFNRKVITATYFSANTKQQQAVFAYERAILKGYSDVATQLSVIDNLSQRYELRAREVEKLTEAIEISSDLFKSARADYIEVLTTRRDALESQMELIENRRAQLDAVADLYLALGGGWR